MNSHLFLQYGLRDDAVSSLHIRIPCGFISFQNGRKLLCYFLSDPPLPQFFIILQGMAGATDVSNFLRAFLMVSLEFLILRVDELDSPQFACVFKMNLFFRPLLLLL